MAGRSPNNNAYTETVPQASKLSTKDSLDEEKRRKLQVLKEGREMIEILSKEIFPLQKELNLKNKDLQGRFQQFYMNRNQFGCYVDPKGPYGIVAMAYQDVDGKVQILSDYLMDFNSKLVRVGDGASRYYNFCYMSRQFRRIQNNIRSVERATSMEELDHICPPADEWFKRWQDMKLDLVELGDEWERLDIKAHLKKCLKSVRDLIRSYGDAIKLAEPSLNY